MGFRPLDFRPPPEALRGQGFWVVWILDRAKVQRYFSPPCIPLFASWSAM